MKRLVSLLLCLVAVSVYAGEGLDTAQTVKVCWNDSECPSSMVCVCPHSDNTGNCDSQGVCIKREDAPEIFLSMDNISFDSKDVDNESATIVN